MRKQLIKLIFTIICVGAMVQSHAQDYQKIRGTYKNADVDCQCNSLGFLSYTKSNGEEGRMYLCFDTEPGSFYEIFNGEQITVEGIVQGMSCGNEGQTFWTMYVSKSELQMQNRRELVPAFIKQQNKSVPVVRDNSSSDQMLEGSYTPKGTTKDDWSDCRHCTSCGRMDGDRGLTINFDQLDSAPDSWGNIRVWGKKDGRDFHVSRWEYLR